MAYGVDSISATYTSVNGTTLANYVKNVYFGVGAPIVFFGRYFSPSPPGDSLDKNNVSLEASTVSHVGIHWIVPLCSPVGGVGGSYNQGHADGTTFCATISYVISNVPNSGIFLPGNKHLPVYLDIEQKVVLSQTYWNGWADAVYWAQHTDGSRPFYPAAYCNPPYGVGQVCSVLANGSKVVDAIWTNQPEYCSYCTTGNNFPAWGPAQGCSGLPTRLWQYAEDFSCINPSCGNRRDWPNIDLDQSGTARDETYYMLWVP